MVLAEYSVPDFSRLINLAQPRYGQGLTVRVVCAVGAV
jgi:hypothetical protein